MVTGRPAFTQAIVIPPPIVPAPMIATRSIGRGRVSAGTSRSFVAARSAKNA